MNTNWLKVWLISAAIFTFGAFSAYAQTFEYSFNTTTGTYEPITGGLLLGTETSDDQRFVDPDIPAGSSTTTGPGLPIGFNFTFNDVVFDRLAINNNGWISLGQSALTPSVNNASTSSYIPLASAVVITPELLYNRISAMGRDLQAQAGASLRLETIGTAPNRVCVVQWANYKKYGTNGTGDSYNFQIRLVETSNQVQLVYGAFTTNATANNFQVGLRGPLATDFNARNTATDWTQTTAAIANTEYCIINQTVFPPNGLTFSFNYPVANQPPNPANLVYPANTATLISPFMVARWAYGGGLPTGYRISMGTDNPPTNIANNIDLANIQQYDPPGELAYNTTYYWKVVPYNAFGEATNCPVWSFTTHGDASITTLPYTQNFDAVTAPDLPFNWTGVILPASTTAAVVTYATSPHSTPNCARIYSGSTTGVNVMLVGPVLHQSIPVNTTRLKFWLKGGSSTYTLQVGVIANPQDPLTFTPIETITTPTTWTEYIVPLNSYTGAGQTIAFRHGFGSTSQAIYVDDVSLELIAENDLACTSITGNTTPSVDFPVTYQANIFNWGFVSQSTYTVKLYNADDVELATAAGITCAPGATVQVPITWTPTVEGPVSIYAKVILPGDQNTTNDQSPSLNVLVMGAGALVVSIGDGTSVNTITGYPTPYGTYYKNFHQQYLYTAADIMANGGAPGLFTAIGFDVQALNTCSPMPNFRIRMKTTQQTALTTTFETGDYTQVWLQNDFLPVVGWNTHTLTTPFYWDGVSNLLVDIVTNLIPGTNTQNSSVYYTPTTGNYTCLRYQSNTVEADIGTTGTVSVNRANIRFNMEALSDPIIMHQIEPITTLMNTDYVLETLDYYFYGDLVNYSIHDNQYIGWAMDSGDITLIPDHNWHGVEYIKIRATNVQGHFVEQTVKVTVWETDSISENFDHSGSVAPGWTTTHSGTTTYPWQPYLVDGVDFGLMTMASLGGTTNERLVSPMFDLSMYQDIQVSFTTDFLPYAGATGTFAYTLNNLTYVTIETIDATFDGIKTYDLPALTGKSSVRFRWTYFNDTQNPGLDNHWVVDNFSIFATVRDIFPPDPVLGFSVQSLGPGSATMQWFASSDQYFCRYQIFISADDQVTTTDQLWSVDNDPLLANVQTISTTLMGLTTGQYWAAIRAVDQSNNYSSLSEAVGIFIDANPPMLSAPIPGNQPLPNWCTTTSATIGCSIEDEHSAVNMTSLQYRLDANGNGMYDYEEVWTDVSLGSTAPGNRNPDHIAFEIELPDNGVFSWELRVADTLGNTAYSGFQGIQGITDDWVVRVDTTPPGEMNVFFVDSIGDNSVQLTWTASSDLNFSGYRIYYGDDPGITMEDALWDFNDDPVMLLPGSGLVSTTITGLIPSTRYYFRLIATDEAGWITAYPEEITAMTSAIDEPLAPQNLTLSIQGDQLVIDWAEVDTDIFGNPISISCYEVYVGDHPYFVCDNESLLTTVSESSLTLDGVIAYADRIFFKIVAVSGAIRSRIPMDK